MGNPWGLGSHKGGNWLTASKGPFNLTMRLLYAPKDDALSGRWKQPAIIEKLLEAAEKAADRR